MNTSSPVLVTGANGYVASWLVKKLLEEGFTVHGTVRDPNNSKKVGHLLALAENSAGTLKLFKADLLEQGAFDEAMMGCEVVYHTASPFIVSNITNAKAQLLDPALMGTENVLTSANRVESVKRVVLTSSVVATYGDNQDMATAGARALNESHWNTTSSESHQPYNYSKVIAEKKAWEMAEQQDRWQLVVVNPGFVLGPSLTQASQSTSLSTIKNLLNGKLRSGVPQLDMGIVDVRDVAEAHFQAGTRADAEGRHILVSGSASLMDLSNIIKNKYPKRFSHPMTTVPKFMAWLFGPLSGYSREFIKNNVGHPIYFDATRAKERLGLTFRSIETAVLDQVAQMIEDGVIK